MKKILCVFAIILFAFAQAYCWTMPPIPETQVEVYGIFPFGNYNVPNYNVPIYQNEHVQTYRGVEVGRVRIIYNSIGWRNGNQYYLGSYSDDSLEIILTPSFSKRVELRINNEVVASDTAELRYVIRPITVGGRGAYLRIVADFVDVRCQAWHTALYHERAYIHIVNFTDSCFEPFEMNKTYSAGSEVSHNGRNYRTNLMTDETPGVPNVWAAWTDLGECSEVALQEGGKVELSHYGLGKRTDFGEINRKLDTLYYYAACDSWELTITPDEGYAAYINGELLEGNTYSLRDRLLTGEDPYYEISFVKICDHNWTPWSPWDTTAPTCEEAGIGMRIQICRICFSTNSEIRQTPALGHDFTSWGSWNTVPASCTEDGNRQRTRTCRRTGCNRIDNEKIITEAFGHNWSDWTVRPATCEANGDSSRVCLHNASHRESYPIAQLDCRRYGAILLDSAVVSVPVTITVISHEVLHNVRMTIFDAVGNAVYDAKDGLQNITTDDGSKTVFTWPLTNNAGRRVASGAYLIIVRATGESQERHVFRAMIGVKR